MDPLLELEFKALVNKLNDISLQEVDEEVVIDVLTRLEAILIDVTYYHRQFRAVNKHYYALLLESLKTQREELAKKDEEITAPYKKLIRKLVLEKEYVQNDYRR